MKSLWKETLLSGRQLDAKSRRFFTISDADVAAAERNINRMVGKGRKIPLIWEHLQVEECSPDEWKANYAKHTFGWVGGARRATDADVRAKLASRPGTLLVRHDVHDDRDVNQLKKTGYVSPKIYREYYDSQGERYTGLAVSHIAASPTVCQWWQQPFSHELSAAEAVYLAYTPPEVEPETDEICPAYTRFSEWLDGLELSATDPEEVPDVAKESDATEGGEGTEGGMGGDLKALIAALRAKGMTISDRVKDLSGLIIAVESSGAAADAPATDNGNPDDDAPGDSADDTAPAGGAPIAMSTLDADPKKKARAEKLAHPERTDTGKEIEALFARGMMTPAEKRQLARQNESLEMSFTADLEPAGAWSKVPAKLDEVRKRTKPVWSLTGNVPLKDGALEMSTTDAAESPEQIAGKAKSGVAEAAAEMEALSKKNSPVK